MQSLRTVGLFAALLALGALAVPSVATAGDGYRRGHPGRGWGPPPRAYYYAPPPPVYYAPPPVYYGPPGVSLNFRF